MFICRWWYGQTKKVYLFLLLQILSCFATLLRKQDVSVWTYPSTLQAYHGLLSFTVHSKPKVCLLSTPLIVRSNHDLGSLLNKNKVIGVFFPFQVRKAAQQGVCAILRGSDFLFTDNAPSHHPAAVSTAKFCIKEMEHAGGETHHLMVTYPALWLSSKLEPVFNSHPQAAKKTPPHFTCWVSWRSWWRRFLWELSSHVARLCYEWWHSAMWWENKHSQMQPSPPQFIFFLIWLMCSWREAGDSRRHAGLSQVVQRQAERFDPLGGTERADHHGETRRRGVFTTQKQQFEN